MGKLSAIRAEIRASWPAIVERSGVRAEALGALPKLPKLLGSGTKTDKGTGKGYLTAVLYMAPATEAFRPGDGRTLCPMATTGCENACLGSKAGRMVMGPIKLSRLWKAALYLGDRKLWRELLRAEAESFGRRALRKGLIPVVRVDGSTDTGEGAKLASSIPWVQFYDYTKVPHRAVKWARGEYPENYHVTFSYSGANLPAVGWVLAEGGNVAAVFSNRPGEAFPSETWGHRVIDGDETDLRFTDPTGVVVGLSFKQAKARDVALRAAMAEGFVLEA